MARPNPVRKVLLAPMAARSFRLPNGEKAQLDIYLDDFVRDSLSQTSNLRALDPASAQTGPSIGQCGRSLVLESKVTAVDLDIERYGVSFGYSPGGELISPVTVTGEVDVAVGSIMMSFHLKECDPVSGCFEAASTVATQATAQTQAGVRVNFTQFQGVDPLQAGLSLLIKTDLGKVFKKIIDDGIRRLAQQPGVAQTLWQAQVRYADPQAGRVILDAGNRANILSGQLFTVFARSSSADGCDVFMPLGRVRTTENIEMGSSEARIERVDSSLRAIEPGDIVMVTP